MLLLELFFLFPLLLIFKIDFKYAIDNKEKKITKKKNFLRKIIKYFLA